MRTRSAADVVKVAFFHAYPQHYGGAQRLTHAVAQELADRGHQATVVLTDEGPFSERLRADGVSTRIVPAPAPWRAYGRALERSGAATAIASLPGYWLELRQAFRSLAADLVHVNDHRGILLAGVGAALARKPVVWHLHASYPSRSITMLGRLLAKRIIVVSEATRREQRWLSSRGRKVTVIHNGLIARRRCDDAEPVVKRERDMEAVKLIVTGARQHPDKGLDVLIRAAAILREREPRLRVVIAGGPQPGYEAHEAELLSLTSALGLEETVSFAGLVADSRELWRSADVYVQPSRREAFGLGVIEAMSVGTPVVTTEVGGLVETVVPERDGLQVPADDPEALASAIGRILNDAELASRLSCCGYERASAFSMEHMIQRLLAIYEQACPGRLAGARP
jgi:glycosyltransferase involved in cell wall biosynthesis